MEKDTADKKDPRVTSTGPSDKNTTDFRKFSPKSTATEAQYQRIDLAFNYVGKLISTLDFRRMGVIHPSGRIKEINEKMGYDIRTVDLRTVIDDEGFAHPRIAFYELIERLKRAA